RHAELAHEPGDRVDAAAEVAVAARLDQLLRRIEMEAERIGADGADERLDLRRRQRAGLDDAEVREDERRRRGVAGGERVGGPGRVGGGGAWAGSRAGTRGRRGSRAPPRPARARG